MVNTKITQQEPEKALWDARLLRDNYALPPTGELFDKASAYTAENY